MINMQLIDERTITEVRLTSTGGVTPEERLFGKYFSNIDECRSLMKRSEAIASGSAVLHALQNDPTWDPSDLDMFVSYMRLPKQGLVEWHNFFSAEGYSLLPSSNGNKPRVTVGAN